MGAARGSQWSHPVLSRAVIAALPLVVLSACEIGTITVAGPGEPEPAGPDAGEVDDPAPDPASPDAAPPEDYSLSLAPDVAEVRLNETAELEITVTSDRFAGPVALSVAGAPTSWTVEVEPSVVTVPADGQASATVRIRVPADGEAMAPATLSVEASAAPGLRASTAAVSVINELVVPLLPGTGGGAHVLPPQMRVRLGASITFVNQDTALHRIHSTIDGDGFPHQPEPGIAPGESYTVTPSRARDDFDYYCHEHGPGTGTALIQVVDPAQP